MKDYSKCKCGGTRTVSKYINEHYGAALCTSCGKEIWLYFGMDLQWHREQTKRDNPKPLPPGSGFWDYMIRKKQNGM